MHLLDSSPAKLLHHMAKPVLKNNYQQNKQFKCHTHTQMKKRTWNGMIEFKALVF